VGIFYFIIGLTYVQRKSGNTAVEVELRLIHQERANKNTALERRSHGYGKEDVARPFSLASDLCSGSLPFGAQLFVFGQCPSRGRNLEISFSP
jgi:hypothetical protein